METKTPDTSDPQHAQRGEDELPIGVLPPTFEPEYVAHVVAPFMLGGRYTGETPSLPMIDLA